MKLTTGFDFQGYFITEYIDVIFDEMLVGIGFGKALLSSVDNLFSALSGGEATEMINKLDNVKATLRNRVISKAERAGANALIGIDFESSRLGDLLMVSMTATAVKIEKILEPLPLTEDTAARIQKEKEAEEKARLAAERRQRLESERQEKIARGEIISIDRSELLENLRKMDSVAEMLEEVKKAMSEDSTLLSDEQLEKLYGCLEIARVYGKRAATQDFIKQTERFLFS